MRLLIQDVRKRPVPADIQEPLVGTAESGGETGIRTLDTGLPYTRVPGVRLQPLGHLTIRARLYLKDAVSRKPMIVKQLHSPHICAQNAERIAACSFPKNP